MYSSQPQCLCLKVERAQKWNKLRYIELNFQNMEINLHANDAQNQGLAENFSKYGFYIHYISISDNYYIHYLILFWAQVYVQKK